VAGRTRPPLWRRALNALSGLWASCEAVAESESEAHDRTRSCWERITVNAHQLYCPPCRRFRRQTRSLCEALRQLRARGEASHKLPGLFLSPEVRERINAALRKADGQGVPGLANTPSDSGPVEAAPDRPGPPAHKARSGETCTQD
jgi:hypothetical protein